MGGCGLRASLSSVCVLFSSVIVLFWLFRSVMLDGELDVLAKIILPFGIFKDIQSL